MAVINLGKVCFIPKGSYSAGMAYEKYDVVIYNGITYAAKKASPAGIVPTNTSYWTKLVEGGIDKTQAAANAGKYMYTNASGEIVYADLDTALTSTVVPPAGKTVKDELDKKVDVEQGTTNAGKILVVGTDGNVTLGNSAIITKTALPTASADNHCQFCIVQGATDKLYINLKKDGSYGWCEFKLQEETDTAKLGNGILGSLVLGKE